MRAIFMGAPAFAVPALQVLSSLPAEIVAVYTKAPRPAGRRGLAATKTPVHGLAESLGLEVRTPATLRNIEALQALRDLHADIAIVAAYRLYTSRTGIAWGYAILHPIAAGLFIYALLRSMIVTASQGGVNWRGTFYSLKDLRKHCGPLW